MKTIQVGDVVGDYRVIDIAGSGGMGSVYQIKHVITHRIEAMKLLPPGLSNDPDQVRRFEREIQLQARLHHPNIAALYNAVRDDDIIALVMEFVEGETLEHTINGRALPVRTAVDYGCQVLRALAYAHRAGVIHRDVSPANILITPEGVAKLTDFGLARGEGDLGLSASGVPFGSAWYMSPEQVKGGQTLDARTDIYSMGAVLHEMLTGHKLFEAVGAFAVMRAQVEAEPMRPGALNPLVPAGLDEIVRKALAKDPAMRFVSADEFLLALQPFAVNEPHGAQRKIHSSRALVAAALMPAALAAGFFTGGRLRQNQPRPAAARADAAPTAAPAAAPPPPAPAQAPPAAAPEEPTDAAPEQPVRKPAHRTTRTEHTTGLRIASEEPTPNPAEAGETAMPTTEPATPILTPPEIPQASTPEPPSPQAAPAEPQNAGSRLVRALGKLNPFRKRTSKEASEASHKNQIPGPH